VLAGSPLVPPRAVQEVVEGQRLVWRIGCHQPLDERHIHTAGARVGRRCISAGPADLQVIGMSPSHSHHVLGVEVAGPTPSQVGLGRGRSASTVAPSARCLSQATYALASSPSPADAGR
jgi:hypothetical protein